MQQKISEANQEKKRKLTLQQDDFIFSDDEFICLKGTFGCGKSLAGLIAACLECEEYPNNLYIIIRKEYVDLKNSTMRDWMNEFGDRYPIVNNQVKFPNKSELIFLHGKDINSIKNINAGGVLMIQAEEMTEDDLWFLKGRLRRREGTRQLRLECNYDGHNWIYKLFNEKKIGKLITTNMFDNSENLPKDYIPGMMKLPKKLQERYVYGSDADMEGVVWDEFSFAKNVIAPFYIPAGWKKKIVLDHGFTNPTAVLWIACDWDKNIYIYDEHYEAGKSVSYHAEQIKKRDNVGISDWLIDPSCAAKTQQKKYADGRVCVGSIIDEYKAEGLDFLPADNNQWGGINRVNELFKSGRLKIFKSCINTIEEVSNWKWKKLKSGVYKNEPDEPQDYKNHACDSLIYYANSGIDAAQYPEEEINENSAWGRWFLAQKQQTGFKYARE